MTKLAAHHATSSAVGDHAGEGWCSGVARGALAGQTEQALLNVAGALQSVGASPDESRRSRSMSLDWSGQAGHRIARRARERAWMPAETAILLVRDNCC